MNIKWEWKDFDEFKPLELYKIMQHRGKIFSVEQNEAFLDADGKDINAWHLLGLIEDDLVGYARVIIPGDENSPVSFGRVSVHQEYRRKGLATQIAEEIFKKLESCAYKNKPIHISAQLYLKEFYEALGFQSYDGVFYLGKLAHTKMILSNPRKGLNYFMPVTLSLHNINQNIINEKD